MTGSGYLKSEGLFDTRCVSNGFKGPGKKEGGREGGRK